MGNSIEKPARKFTVVCGDMAYDEEKENIQCPPTTVNNKKALPQYGMPILEGEVAINLGYAKYQKDGNGKIVNVKFLEKEEYKKEEKKVQEESR